MKPSSINHFSTNAVAQHVIHFSVNLILFAVLSAVGFVVSSCATSNATRQYFGYRNSYPPPQHRSEIVQSKNERPSASRDRLANRALLDESLSNEERNPDEPDEALDELDDFDNDSELTYFGSSGNAMMDARLMMFSQYPLSLGAGNLPSFWEQQSALGTVGYMPMWQQVGWGRGNGWRRWHSWNYWNRWSWWCRPLPQPRFWHRWRAWQYPRFWRRYFRFPVRLSFWSDVLPVSMPPWQHIGGAPQDRQPAFMPSHYPSAGMVVRQPSRQTLGQDAGQSIVERRSRDFGVQRPHNAGDVPGGVQSFLPASQFRQSSPSSTVQVWQQPETRLEVRPSQRSLIMPAEEPVKRGSVIGSATEQSVAPERQRSDDNNLQQRNEVYQRPPYIQSQEKSASSPTAGTSSAEPVKGGRIR
jgi:hypothetical protein